MARRDRAGGVRLATAAAAPARRPQEAVLREVLLQRDGWCPAGGPALKVRVRRRHYLLKPLARGEGWRLYLCESPRHAALPVYADRRELHLYAAGEGERRLTVFSDAAGMRQVWSWTRRRAFGVAAYTEEYRDAAVDREGEAIALPEAEVDASVEEIAEARAGAEAALGILIGRLRRAPTLRRLLGRPVGDSPIERLQRMIEESRAPEVPRRVWSELERLRILDPRCGAGGWLSGCLLGLGTVASACLQRMQPWVEEAVPARADRHADFRRLTARARELGRGGVRDRLALEVVLLRCLRGVEEDPAAAMSCRRALAARLTGGCATAESEAMVDLRWGRLGGAVRSTGDLAERARRAPEVAAVAGAIGAEAEALARAEEQLIRMRLRGVIGGGDLEEGRREIQRRRRAISRLLMEEGEGSDRPLLLPWIEYQGILHGGGFHLVRGEDALPPGGAADGSAD